MVSKQPTDNTQQSVPTVRLIHFLDFLRKAGFKVGVQETLDSLRIIDLCCPFDEQTEQIIRQGLRSLVCLSREDWSRFNVLFEDFWYPQRHLSNKPPVKRDPRVLHSSQSAAATGFSQLMDVDLFSEETTGEEKQGRRGAGRQTALANSDFRFLTDRSALREMEELAESLATLLRRRLTRRQQVVKRGKKPHMRRTFRNSLAYGGLPIKLSYRERRREFPRLILLLDISHSMAQYSYLLTRFTRGLILNFPDAEAFLFHTRLHQITCLFRQTDVDMLRKQLEKKAPLWMGGTRIADSLKNFNREFSRRVIHSRSFVIIMSDGFDSDAPERLVEELRLLRRRAKKILWLNPMLGQGNFDLSDTMPIAALPLLDLIAPAHSVKSLQEVITYLSTV
jgi:uncharacterized protein with von Willebrand factor type A (vWA) domain